MGAFWGSDRKWDSISKGFQAELFCYIQMEITQLEERASKLGFGWLIMRSCVCAFHLAELLGTSGGGQKVPASAEGKPMHFCLLCLSAAQPGIWRDYHLNTARGKRIICLTEILGVTKFFFYSQAHSNKMAGADSIAHKKQYRFNSNSKWMWLQFVLSVALVFLFCSSLWSLLRSFGDFFVQHYVVGQVCVCSCLVSSMEVFWKMTQMTARHGLCVLMCK